MNKFAILALLALSCQMVCAGSIKDLESRELSEDTESQLSLVPTDDTEIAYLADGHKIFSSYCIQSRDYVVQDVRATTNKMAANVFLGFFSFVSDVQQEVMNTERVSTDRLSTQIRDPKSRIEEAQDEAEQIIAGGQKKIQEADAAATSVYQGFLTAMAAAKTTMYKSIVSKLQQLKSSFGILKLSDSLLEACNTIDRYENELRQRFSSFRDDAKDSDQTLAKLRLEDVACLSTSRILKAQNLCRFAKIAHIPVRNMFA